jgi:hypothetical protein
MAKVNEFDPNRKSQSLMHKTGSSILNQKY